MQRLKEDHDRLVLSQQDDDDGELQLLGGGPRVGTDSAIQFGSKPKTARIHLVDRSGTTRSTGNVNDWLVDTIQAVLIILIVTTGDFTNKWRRQRWQVVTIRHWKRIRTYFKGSFLQARSYFLSFLSNQRVVIIVFFFTRSRFRSRQVLFETLDILTVINQITIHLLSS